MSKNIWALLVGIGAAIVTSVVAPFVIPQVDEVWWTGSFPGTSDITGREFLASCMGLGGWFVALVHSINALERKR